MKQKKVLSFFILTIAMLFSLLPLALVVTMFVSRPPSLITHKDAIGIGISMHSTSSERWVRDGQELKLALEEKGYSVALTFTDGGDQAAQIDDLLAQNIKVLVVCADDPTAIGGALSKVVDKGVKILAYDRLPTDTTSVDALVTFDSRQVGRMQAEFAIQRLASFGTLTAKDPAVIDIIGGDRTDPNARWVVEGALEVLTPYIEVGMVVDPGDADSLLLDSWNAETGKARMQTLLETGHKSDAVLCGNDALLAGALDAMDGVAGLPNGIYVGQDGTAAIATRIANGSNPLASIFKDSRLLTQQAAEVADAMARDVALPPTDGTRFNGKKDVTTYFSPLETLSISNYRRLLLDSGYYTTAELHVDPDAPLTVGTLLSTLFMWEDTRITDVEQRGLELGLLGAASSTKALRMEDTLSRGDTSGIIMSYCLKTGFLPQASKALSFADADALPASFVRSMEFCNAHDIFRDAKNHTLELMRIITRQEWDTILDGLAQAKHNVNRNDPDIAYASAVADAVTVEQQEILPLKTSITKTDPNVSWNETEDKLLVLTWNDQPEDYLDGVTRTAGDDGIWVFSDKELIIWYSKNTMPITDLNLRLEQLIGLPPDAGYTTMTALWVAPDQLTRPAYQSDITDATMSTTLTGHTNFQDWFRKNAANTYGESPYPWTRLGYTYDWANNGTEYGLTEFLVRPGSEIEVAFSKTTQDFFAEMDRQLPSGGNYTDEMKIPYTIDLDIAAGSDSTERQGDHPDSPYFPQMDYFNAKSTDTFTILPRFKTTQETSEMSCGASTAIMVLDYFGKLGNWNEETLTALCADHSTQHDGFCLDQLIEMLSKVEGLELETTYDYKDNPDAINASWLRARIETGIPVIIGWNDWGAHWEVAIGYDTMGTEYEGDDVLIVADPYDSTDHNQDGYGVYGAERFIYNFTFYDFFPEGHARDKCFVAVKSAK